MCLGIPMRVIKIKKPFACVETGGLRRQINIAMLPSVKLNDYVIVHAGFAIEIIDPEAAKDTLRLIDEIHR